MRYCTARESEQAQSDEPSVRRLLITFEPDDWYRANARMYQVVFQLREWACRMAIAATAFPGLRQDVCFTYKKPAQAIEAAERIAECLVSGADECSQALQSEYSNANLLEFLARHLSRDGLMFMQWTGLVKLERTGLLCFLPSETWDTMHVEDLVDSAIEWQQDAPDPNTASRGVAAHQMFGLSPRITWLARAKVSRPIADTQMFPE